MPRFSILLFTCAVLVIALAFADESNYKPHVIAKRAGENKFVKYHGIGKGSTKSYGTLDKEGSGREGQPSTGGKASTSDGHSTVGGTIHFEAGSGSGSKGKGGNGKGGNGKSGNGKGGKGK